MVKLGRGGRRHLPGREPMPLFPPGDLPVFGPPPVNHRRPPPPPRRGFPPPPPPPISRPPPPPHMRPPPPLRLCPPPPPAFPPGQRRPLLPPVRPLLQTPILPPRGVPFPRGMPGRGLPLRGRGRGGPFNRLGKNMKKMKNKKLKGPKDLNEGEFYCETCDRGWETVSELQEHIDEHVLCGREGCAFSAAPKLVAIHIKLQHETGLFQKISSQEDAKKWIEERRKNYPTKENIERKTAALQEMEKRGEPVKNEKPFRTNNNQRISMKGISKTGNKKNIKRGLKTFTNRFNDGEDELFCVRITPFRGIRGLSPPKDEEHYNDEIWNETFDDVGNSSQTQSTLQALASSYASCSESEEDEGPEEVRSLVEKPSPDDVPKPEPEAPVPVPKPVVEERLHIKPYPSKRSRHVFPSLLEKLLKDEIWRERSVILQCIRYCVEQSFFQSKTV